MSWRIRHQGSPKAVEGLSLVHIVEGLQDEKWDLADEVMGPGDRRWYSIDAHPQLESVAAEIDEARNRTIDEDDPEEQRIDMNPLIDVCLVLLIFFMITTTYVAAVQKVVPLQSASGDAKTAVKQIHIDQVKKQMIRVQALGDKSGKVTVRVENQPVLKDVTTLDGDKLRDALLRYVRGSPPKDEVLLDAQGVTWGMVIAIQDAAKSAGVRAVLHLKPKK